MNWEIVKQVAGGLAACHARGLMHRDIKPDNSIDPVPIWLIPSTLHTLHR
jgi:hypothetical protein